MTSLIRRFCNDDSGATAIEYALIASGIAVAIVAAVGGIGVRLNANFASVNASLK